MAAGASRGELCRCAVVPRHDAVWLVCEGLRQLRGGLWLAERGHRAAGVVVHCLCDCPAGGGDERPVVSEDGRGHQHRKKGIAIVGLTPRPSTEYFHYSA